MKLGPSFSLRTRDLMSTLLSRSDSSSRRVSGSPLGFETVYQSSTTPISNMKSGPDTKP